MRFVVDVSEARANTISQLINGGRYKSVGQFIETAIENQLYLETSDGHRIVSTLRENSHKFSDSPARPPSLSFQEKPLTIRKESHDATGYPETITTVNLKLPDRKLSLRSVPTPRFDELAASLASVDENKTWLWGQINKILPVKVGLRILYLSLIDLGESIELNQFKDKAADVAFAVGEMIREHEDKRGKKRDERISAGLPGGDEPFKSKSRYKNHFLAYMRKDGKLDGAMSLLKFVNMQEDGRGRLLIGLTEAGSDLARLENPPIDAKDLDNSLGAKEVDFYLRHIQKNVPGEFQAILWLLKTISDGTAVRVEINAKLKEDMGKIWRASDAVIDTQRAGLTSRASELGLIRAIRSDVGITVHYEVTTEGKSLIS